MAARTNGGLITFGVINMIVAVLPFCCSFGGTMNLIGNPQILVQDRNFVARDVGPQFKNQIERDAPHAKYEAIGAIICNSLLSLLLIIGAIGLFLTQPWGRWLTIGTAVLLVLTSCVHDIYVFAVMRPLINNFLDAQVPPGPQGEGFKLGFSAGFFCWSYLNPIIMIYLVGMCIYLGVTTAFDAPERGPRRRRRRDDDDDDEDEEDDYFGRRRR